MSMDYCQTCDRHVDTDEDLDGIISEAGYECGQCFEKRAAEYAYLRSMPKSYVMDVEDDAGYREEMIDAGRGHLVRR